MKNTEGYDRIPQRILVDVVDQLLDSFVGLFDRIYNQTSVLAQWLLSLLTTITTIISTHNGLFRKQRPDQITGTHQDFMLKRKKANVTAESLI